MELREHARQMDHAAKHATKHKNSKSTNPNQVVRAISFFNTQQDQLRRE